jgi:hypothetical protein
VSSRWVLRSAEDLVRESQLTLSSFASKTEKAFWARITRYTVIYLEQSYSWSRMSSLSFRAWDDGSCEQGSVSTCAHIASGRNWSRSFRRTLLRGYVELYPMSRDSWIDLAQHLDRGISSTWKAVGPRKSCRWSPTTRRTPQPCQCLHDIP